MPSRKRTQAPSAPAAIDVNMPDGPISVIRAPELPAAPAEGDPPSRDAIVFVPSITGGPGMGLDDVALRVANAMNSRAATSRALFSVATRDVEVGKDRKLRTATILRHETARDEGRPLVDLYEFDYRSRISRNFADKPPYRQALTIAATLLRNTPALFLAVTRRSKGLAQKLQVMYGAAFFGLLLLYLVLLVAAVIGTAARPAKATTPKVEQVAEGGSAPSAAAAAPAPVARMEKAVPGQPPSLDAAAEVQESKGLGGMLAWLIRAFRTGRWLNWAKTGIVSLTLVGFVVRFNMRGALDQAAPALSSMSEYLSAGRNRTEMIGELARLIDALDECPPSGVEYRKIHLFGYSFGSVVVLDALFQQETEVSPRFGRIDTLVTVGSPFDFIRTFWPDYFTDRRALPGAPGRWINVYSEIDVLGSNFLDEPSWKDRRRHRRAKPAERAAIEREWAETLAQGVDLREGGSRRPSEGDNVAFGAAQGTGLTVLSWLKLTGFRVHANYWDRESPAAVSCFDPVITRLYAGDTAVPALA